MSVAPDVLCGEQSICLLEREKNLSAGSFFELALAIFEVNL